MKKKDTSVKVLTKDTSKFNRRAGMGKGEALMGQ